jgi:hypothetical protein
VIVHDDSYESYDWYGWHSVYEEPDSRFAARLVAVQTAVRQVVDAAPAGAIVALDVGGGQSLGILGALDGHPRAPDVTLQLVERDARNIAAARAGTERIGLGGFVGREGDGGWSDTYAGLAPADLIVISGVFAHMSPRDERRTISHLREVAAPGAHLVWTGTNGSRAGRLRRRLRRHGFRHDTSATTRPFRVGTSVLVRPPRPLHTGVHWFTFVPINQTRANKARVTLGRWKRQLLRRPLDA